MTMADPPRAHPASIKTPSAPRASSAATWSYKSSRAACSRYVNPCFCTCRMVWGIGRPADVLLSSLIARPATIPSPPLRAGGRRRASADQRAGQGQGLRRGFRPADLLAFRGPGLVEASDLAVAVV